VSRVLPSPRPDRSASENDTPRAGSSGHRSVNAPPETASQPCGLFAGNSRRCARSDALRDERLRAGIALLVAPPIPANRCAADLLAGEARNVDWLHSTSRAHLITRSSRASACAGPNASLRRSLTPHATSHLAPDATGLRLGRRPALHVVPTLVREPCSHLRSQPARSRAQARPRPQACSRSPKRPRRPPATASSG
jgi:hypothetical protein